MIWNAALRHTPKPRSVSFDYSGIEGISTGIRAEAEPMQLSALQISNDAAQPLTILRRHVQEFDAASLW